MDTPRSDRMQIFDLALASYEPELRQYTQQWLKSELEDEDIEQMESLYTKAESDPLLNFIITELDRILGQRVGLLEAKFLKEYKDQQAWLREHLEQFPLESEDLIATQKFLNEIGFYEGPLDGVWGKRSRNAVIQYLMEVQKLLRQIGLYNGNIDGEFGSKSVLAVQEFQNAHNLKCDGVPREKTFGELRKIR